MYLFLLYLFWMNFERERERRNREGEKRNSFTIWASFLSFYFFFFFFSLSNCNRFCLVSIYYSLKKCLSFISQWIMSTVVWTRPLKEKDPLEKNWQRFLIPSFIFSPSLSLSLFKRVWEEEREHVLFQTERERGREQVLEEIEIIELEKCVGVLYLLTNEESQKRSSWSNYRPWK